MIKNICRLSSVHLGKVCTVQALDTLKQNWFIAWQRSRLGWLWSLLLVMLWASLVVCLTGYVKGPVSSSPVGQLPLECTECSKISVTHGLLLRMHNVWERGAEDKCSSSVWQKMGTREEPLKNIHPNLAKSIHTSMQASACRFTYCSGIHQLVITQFLVVWETGRVD